MDRRTVTQFGAASLIAIVASAALGQSAPPPIGTDVVAPPQSRANGQAAQQAALRQQFSVSFNNVTQGLNDHVNQLGAQALPVTRQIKAPYAREYQQYVAELKKNGPPTPPKGSNPSLSNPATLIDAKKAQLLQRQARELAKVLDPLMQERDKAMGQLRKQKQKSLAELAKMGADQATLADAAAAYDSLQQSVELMFARLLNQVKAEAENLDVS